MRGAAGGDQVIDDEDLLSGRMASSWISTASVPYSRLYSRRTVFAGSLPGLRAGTKPAFNSSAMAGPEDEAAGFDAHDQVHRRLGIVARHRFHRGTQRLRIFDQRGDIFELDAGLGEVRDIADELLIGEGGDAVLRRGVPARWPWSARCAGFLRPLPRSNRVTFSALEAKTCSTDSQVTASSSVFQQS